MTPQTLQFSATNGAVTSGSPLNFSVAGGQSISLDLSNHDAARHRFHA